MNASVFQLAFVDVRCGVFENKFVSPDVPSSIHNRITSNFDPIDFECENIQRNKRLTGEPSAIFSFCIHQKQVLENPIIPIQSNFTLFSNVPMFTKRLPLSFQEKRRSDLKAGAQQVNKNDDQAAPGTFDNNGIMNNKMQRQESIFSSVNQKS